MMMQTTPGARLVGALIFLALLAPDASRGHGRADHRPATPQEIARVRDLLGADARNRHRRELSGVRATPGGWICGEARDPDERDSRGRPRDPAFADRKPFVLDPVSGRLIFPLSQQDPGIDAMAVFNANCPGRVAR